MPNHPALARAFEERLERASFLCPDLAAVRDALVSALGDDADDLAGGVAVRLGRDARPDLIAVVPPPADRHLRAGADMDLAARAIAEALERLMSGTGRVGETRDAERDLMGEADEGVTWRLREAADAAHAAVARPLAEAPAESEDEVTPQPGLAKPDRRTNSGRNRRNSDGRLPITEFRRPQPNSRHPRFPPPAQLEHRMAKDDEPKKPEDTPEAAGPMLDMSQAAVKKMIATAKARGYITYDELNEVLPPEQVTSEQIEDVMAMLSEMGINVIDNDEAEEEDGARDDAAPSPRTSGSRELAMTTRRRRGARPHRRPGAHVPARDGLGRAPVARGRDRHRQAHRGRAQHDDRRASARARSPSRRSPSGATSCSTRRSCCAT